MKFRWYPSKHDRVCENIEQQIDYETEYAQYEVSKAAIEEQKRKERIQKIKYMCRKVYSIITILILIGK